MILATDNRLEKKSKKTHKNGQNIGEILKIPDILAKYRKFPIFGEKIKIGQHALTPPLFSKNRRYITGFLKKSTVHLDHQILSWFDPTVQIPSVFLNASNGYIFYPTVDFKSEV